jgi:hypothetical protein
MQHRGQRSLFRQQQSHAKRFIQNTCRHDQIRAEQICMLTQEQVEKVVQLKFDVLMPGAVDCEPGQVTVDSRGTGSFQLPASLKEWTLATGS